jgi:hypothetical protein
MKHAYILPFIAALLCSCVSATAEIKSVCAAKELTVPAAPASISAAVGVRTVSKSFDEDFSDTLGNISDIADVSINSFGLSLTGNVAFIKHVKLTMQSDRFVDIVLSDSEVLTSGKTISVPFTSDLNKLQPALAGGKVTLKVDVTGLIPETETALSSTLCVGVSGKVEKSL